MANSTVSQHPRPVETEAMRTGEVNEARKPGDYSAIVEELHELEEHVEALREKMRKVRRKSTEGGGS